MRRAATTLGVLAILLAGCGGSTTTTIIKTETPTAATTQTAAAPAAVPTNVAYRLASHYVAISRYCVAALGYFAGTHRKPTDAQIMKKTAAVVALEQRVRANPDAKDA